MVVDNSLNKVVADNTFLISQMAEKQKIALGKENVINGSLGVFYNENEELYTLESVTDEFKNLNTAELFAYASAIDGDQNFKNAVKLCILGENYETYFKKSKCEVVSTPGGTGAIYNTFKNYLHAGEKVLVPELMWSSYKIIANECGGSHSTYSLFKDNKFDLENFKNSVLELAKVQRSLIVVLNDPCQNPTGYSLTRGEWIEVIDILKLASQHSNIILLKDIAYAEFDEYPTDVNDLFDGLPQNILVMLCFSISKSFCSYGLRVGAQMAISSSPEVLQTFLNANKYSARGTWSNISKGGMTMFSNLVLNPTKYSTLLKERKVMIDLLKERKDIFLEHARKENLEIHPHSSGFFMSIPLTKDFNEVIEDLRDDNVFLIGNGLGGLRVALCSIPKAKIPSLVKKIKKHI